MKTREKLFALTLLIPFFCIQCDTANTDSSQNSVAIQFQTQGVQQKAFSSGDTLNIIGTNGTLEITDIAFIVEEFELEKEESACSTTGSDDCEEIELPPYYLDLPLDGSSIALNSASINPGLYEEISFEVDDLDLDEEDQDERDDKQRVLNQVLGLYPEWPREASMVVTGTFTDSNNDVRSFTTFIEAEIEVEIEFEPPLQVNDNSNVEEVVTVNINPTLWFTSSNGNVIDLSTYDYATTQDLLELEVEIENGFTSIERDDDDNDDDDDDD